MSGKFITARRIHDGLNWCHPNTTIEVSDDGHVVACHHDPKLMHQATFYDGTILPAFVNVHTHLELSHMQGRIPRHTGLIPFLQQVAGLRNDDTETQKKEARHQAFQAMYNRGVIAAGDIANTADSMDLRAHDLMHLHTFVECIGFTETHAHQRFTGAQQLLLQFAAQPTAEKTLRQSIVPHAPYSVSEPLFRLIANAADPQLPLTIHNQESTAENRFYKDKTGEVNELLNGLGIAHHFFRPTGTTSLQSYLPWMDTAAPLIFVHNTCTTPEDVRFAQMHRQHSHWCLCPNANLYIENQLPDVPMLAAQEGINICIGTDSLASNDRLCVLSELRTLKQHFPKLTWETLFRWGTANGAAALHMPHLGRLQPGTKPGIIQISKDGQLHWVLESRQT